MGFLAPFFEVSESSNCWSEKTELGGLPRSSGVATAVLFRGLWGSLEKWSGKEDDTRGTIRPLFLHTQTLLSFAVNFTQKIHFLCLPHQGFCPNVHYFLSGLLAIFPSSAFASVFPKSFWLSSFIVWRRPMCYTETLSVFQGTMTARLDLEQDGIWSLVYCVCLHWIEPAPAALQ